ncbi:MAG: hypothetical protein DDG59_03420 [Anaerolineae bacterium]|jgi:hypothetical protein|nr:MAG: hypothetical protein DDG59_03420 [Anaerolineae bacterium]
MHITQTFVLRLFIDPDGEPMLKGLLHSVRDNADYPFRSGEELLLLLRELNLRRESGDFAGEGTREPANRENPPADLDTCGRESIEC